MTTLTIAFEAQSADPRDPHSTDDLDVVGFWLNEEPLQRLDIHDTIKIERISCDLFRALYAALCRAGSRIAGLAPYRLGARSVARCQQSLWSYAHSEIEQACGGPLALHIRRHVLARRASVDTAIKAGSE